jgi:secondary thiamine-phosphate synthase enzyme
MIHTETLTLISDGRFHAFNVTEDVRAAVRAAGIRAGVALVFYRHTTGAVMLVEHEAGMLLDLEEVLEQITPVARDYKHHLRGVDLNGAAHVRTALMNASVTVPVLDGDLAVGTYQDIVVLDMDPEPRPRTVIVQVMGE